MLNQDNEKIIQKINKKTINNSKFTNKEKALEWFRCKQNPFYFIYNYVYIPEHATGGSFKLTSSNLHLKMKRVVKSIYNHHKAVLMASRQLGKSSIAACLIAWALVFYPGIQSIILNMRKNAGQNNLKTIKFIIQKLPSWMVTNNPFKSKSDILTYITLFNNSRADVFYPSTTHSADTLARSLTSPILYIDEAAFIRDMRVIFGSAQQTLSKARLQAEKSGYPHFLFVTSTPNGTSGLGEWFFNRWNNSVDSDFIFENDVWRKNVNVNKIVTDPSRNSFIGIKFHWSEDSTKNEKWYQQQCQELSDQRLINQELDLLFVGSTNCIFSDDLLSSFNAQKSIETITTSNNASFQIFENDLDPSDYYILGADTAESLNGAYCTIEIFGFRNFNQVAELEHRYGSYTAFGQDIDQVFRLLRDAIGSDNIILAVENNTIGHATIEHLLYHVDDIDYRSYLFKEDLKHNKDDKYGVSTTGMTKPLMVGCLTQFINENTDCIKSQKLIDQFGNIEKTNSGTVKSTGYSDLFMASCFCALVRQKKALDIMPIITQGSPQEYQKKEINVFTEILGLGNKQNLIKNNKQKMKIDSFISADDSDDENDISEAFSSMFEDEQGEFLPFFNS